MAKLDPAERRPAPVLKALPSFWRALKALTPEQRAVAEAVFPKFKANPFDPSLRPHRINKLSARYGRTIWSVCIAGDLRAVFYVADDQVVSVDIGTHAIYR